VRCGLNRSSGAVSRARLQRALEDTETSKGTRLMQRRTSTVRCWLETVQSRVGESCRALLWRQAVWSRQACQEMIVRCPCGSQKKQAPCAQFVSTVAPKALTLRPADFQLVVTTRGSRDGHAYLPAEKRRPCVASLTRRVAQCRVLNQPRLRGSGNEARVSHYASSSHGMCAQWCAERHNVAALQKRWECCSTLS
jgi:hypothetical protein